MSGAEAAAVGPSAGMGATRPPSWLHELGSRAARMPVPARLRPQGAHGRPSAVLILFGRTLDGHEDVLLIQKEVGLRRHSGQPAFPGGAQEPEDGDAETCALREATEETGLDPAGVQVLALLPELYLPPSGFRITPVLAWWHTPSAVWPTDPREVAAVTRVPLAELVQHRVRVCHPDGLVGPGFQVRDMLVWGFTGMVLHRLLVLGAWVSEDLPEHTVSLPPVP